MTKDRDDNVAIFAVNNAQIKGTTDNLLRNSKFLVFSKSRFYLMYKMIPLVEST